MKRNLQRTRQRKPQVVILAIAAATAAGLGWVSTTRAQAPPAQGKGPAVERPIGMENGLTYFQTQLHELPSRERFRESAERAPHPPDDAGADLRGGLEARPSGARSGSDRSAEAPHVRIHGRLPADRQRGSRQSEELSERLPLESADDRSLRGRVLERLGRGHREHALSKDGSRRNHQRPTCRSSSSNGRSDFRWASARIARRRSPPGASSSARISAGSIRSTRRPDASTGVTKPASRFGRRSASVR